MSMYIGFTIGNKYPDFTAPFYINMFFDEYWNELVYMEDKIQYTRKQLILWASNKLGGTHVDPEIPNMLVRLVGNESAKLVSTTYGEETIINQVVFEMAVQVIDILKQLIPELEKTIS